MRAAQPWPISRRIKASGSAVGEALITERADRGGGDRHVDDHADDHRADNADGQVAIGVLGFLGGGSDGVEAVESEEDDRSSGHHPDLAARWPAAREAVGHERVKIGGVEHRKGDGQEQRQRGEFDHHQDRVERGAFAGAGDEQAGDDDDDEDGGEIDDSAKLGAVDQCRRQAQPDRLARRRDHCRHLGICERGARANHAGDGEGQYNRGAGLGGANPDQREDAGPDNRTDAERDKVRPAQGPREPMMLGHILTSDNRLADVPVLHALPHSDAAS